MTITILYNTVTTLSEGSPEDILADEDSIKTVNAIKETLLELGHSVDLFDINEESIEKLKNLKTDLIFNQAFGIGNIPNTEGEVVGILEKAKLPFTGSPKKAIDLSNNKLATKKLLMENNIPTPRLFDQNSKIKFPVIIKLAASHCSIGLSQNSVVTSPEELEKQVLDLSKKYKTKFIIEEYVDGRELNVCILGNGSEAKVLPVSEILFAPTYKNKFKIIDFAAKWLEASDEYQGTLEAVCPAKLDDQTLSQINKFALAAYHASGCRDYARVDMRLTTKNAPYVLEVNANPAIGPGDGAIRSAHAAGISYSQFIHHIVEFGSGR